MKLQPIYTDLFVFDVFDKYFNLAAVTASRDQVFKVTYFGF